MRPRALRNALLISALLWLLIAIAARGCSLRPANAATDENADQPAVPALDEPPDGNRQPPARVVRAALGRGPTALEADEQAVEAVLAAGEEPADLGARR